MTMAALAAAVGTARRIPSESLIVIEFAERPRDRKK